MSAKPLIVRRLKPEEWDAFHAFILVRSTTIDDAHAWLLDRGHDVSRASVGRYVQKFHRRPSTSMRWDLEINGDDEAAAS